MVPRGKGIACQHITTGQPITAHLLFVHRPSACAEPGPSVTLAFRPTESHMNAEKYLRPEVINQVARLDLRAKFIVEGFLAGLHASPYHGFSVEFSEHRKYVPGDDVRDIDWNVYSKTDKYYLRKYEAETNVTGYLVMDLSAS